MNANANALLALNLEQRRSGVQWEYYRQGLDFDQNAPHIQLRIAQRNLPHNNIVSANNAGRNLALLAIRNNRLTNKDFRPDAPAKVNIAAQAANKNQNDIAQALADFRALKTLHGDRLKCQ